MDSPELKYLKAMHQQNKKFYAHASLELADINALVAVLSEMVKADIALRNSYDLQGFEAQVREKQLEYQKAFRESARDRLERMASELDSET